MYWAATAMPLSRFAESIRSMKLAIDLNPTNTSNKIIGITSALPNEGKSTIAASLAQLIAHAGKQVIIVDCDLRNPVSFRQSCAERPRWHYRCLIWRAVSGGDDLEGLKDKSDLVAGTQEHFAFPY